LLLLVLAHDRRVAPRTSATARRERQRLSHRSSRAGRHAEPRRPCPGSRCVEPQRRCEGLAREGHEGPAARARAGRRLLQLANVVVRQNFAAAPAWRTYAPLSTTSASSAAVRRSSSSVL